jgi:quercetin dioxygenase-like cupin family protein
MNMRQEGYQRTAPRLRFAADTDRFDLNQAAEALLCEGSGQNRHQQIALFKHGPATLALYCFKAGSSLPDHVVDGPVIIHTLEGCLSVRTDEGELTLEAGQLLRLAPGVRHDIAAISDSRMLLNICIEGPDSHRLA